MNVLQTLSFKKALKKLHANQKQQLDDAIKLIIANPNIGAPKKGDLAGISVYKFKMIKQPVRLAYHYQDETITLTLLSLGTHENFYKSLKT